MPAPTHVTPAPVAEETRIRAAYARRDRADRYSWFNAAHLLAVQERERRTVALLQRHGYESLAETTILELGCGTGLWLREFLKWGARPSNLAGVDLLEDRIAEARRLCPPELTLICASAIEPLVPPRQFDIVLQSMVATSILDPAMRQALANAMLAALRPGGMILWYDYHTGNPRNRDVRAVTRREIGQLFPGCRIELQRITVAPPLARLIAPRARWLYSLLQLIPLVKTHYLGVIRPLSGGR
jgi:SAM-dependent methyltransferase